jgi:hypothetical protein
MTNPDHELALDVACRLQLAQRHDNPAHVLLALKAAGHAVAEHGAKTLPETLDAVGEALPVLAQSLDPEAPDLAAALSLKTACGRHGHQLRAAQREYEWHQLLEEVERLVREKSLKTRAACREVALANGVNHESLRDKVLERWPSQGSDAVAGMSLPYPTTGPMLNDEPAINASPVLAPMI